MADFFNNFHFLRPYILYALLPLGLSVFFIWQRKSQSNQWLKVVDPALQPHVLSSAETRKSNTLWLWVLAALIAIVSLAGPVWKQLPQSVYQPKSALIVILDLSRSMDAQDIKPSRLQRAKHKVIDLLNARTEGQVALIAYAAHAFSVSPLTKDKNTVLSLMKALSTDIMPAQGSRLDIALAQASALFKQSNILQGHILVISDGITNFENEAINSLDLTPHNISVLAVGTEQGAPIALKQGGFLKDKNNSIVITQLKPQNLLTLTQKYSGTFATLRPDNVDIQALINATKLNKLEAQTEKTEFTFDQWVEQGPWLLWLILPIALTAFRRGYWVLVAAFIFPITLPQPSHALDWKQWFINDNQKAQQKFQNQDYDAAAQQFNNPNWKAAANYKNQKFESSLEHYQLQGEQGLYNKGNSLARLQRYEEALKAWDDLLETQPNHEDALYNKKQLEEFLNKQQKQPQSSDENSDSESDSDSNSQQQQSEQQQNQDQNQQSQSDDQTDSENTESENTESKNEESEGKDSEKKEADAKETEAQKAEAEKNKQQHDPLDEQEKSEALAQNTEQEQQALDEETQKWLRRIPDDPGGLMRNKFRYQYRQLKRQNNEQNPW